MTKVVRVDHGIVVEVFEAMPAFHETLMAQIRTDAPLDVGYGWVFDGTQYGPPLPPPGPSSTDYLRAVKALLDYKAQERDYDNIVSACSYADSAIETYRLESAALMIWRDEVWQHCYARLAAIEAGRASSPSLADFVADMPSFSWPN